MIRFCKWWVLELEFWEVGLGLGIYLVDVMFWNYFDYKVEFLSIDFNVNLIIWFCKVNGNLGSLL